MNKSGLGEQRWPTLRTRLRKDATRKHEVAIYSPTVLSFLDYVDTLEAALESCRRVAIETQGVRGGNYLVWTKLEYMQKVIREALDNGK